MTTDPIPAPKSAAAQPDIVDTTTCLTAPQRAFSRVVGQALAADWHDASSPSAPQKAVGSTAAASPPP
jgi:hypothetical protein